MRNKDTLKFIFISASAYFKSFTLMIILKCFKCMFFHLMLIFYFISSLFKLKKDFNPFSLE